MYRSSLRLLTAGLVVLSLVAGLPPAAHTGTVAHAARPDVRADEQLKTALASLEQGRLLLRRYEADRAYTQLQTALRHFTEMGDGVGQAFALDALGDVYAQSGQYDVAFEHYRRAHENFRAGGDAVNANAVLAKRAERHLLLGDLDGARAAFAAMTVAPPARSLKESGVPAAAARREEADRKRGAAALPGLAVCFAPFNPSDNIDPKNPPNQGRAPVTQNGVGRMDLRVTDAQGNPLEGVRADLQSKRPGGFVCDCMNTTDAAGRALLPPLHIADQVKLVLSAPGMPAQELTLAAQSLAEPVRVALSQAGARVVQQAAGPALPPPDACFNFYRALFAFATSEAGRARADFFAGRLPEARRRYEDLLAQLELPGVEGFRPTLRFRAAALTALGDIATREGRHADAAKLYAEVLDATAKGNRLDLRWAAQRGLARSAWQQYLAAPKGDAFARLLDEAMNSYLAAVRSLDALRAGSLRADESRTAFLAGTRDVYDEALEVLAEIALHDSGPGASESASKEAVALTGSPLSQAAAAVAVVEQSRARALLDMLGEARAGITEGLPAELVRQRNEVQARQQEIASILSGVLPPPVDEPRKSVTELERELENLSGVYNGLENDIRTRSPRYASLADASPLALTDIQQKVLDDKTALLLYNLGEGASYLWVVTQTGVAVARLPARAVIESKVSALRAQLIPSRLRRPLDGIDAPADASRGLTHEADAKQAPAAAAKPGARSQTAKPGGRAQASKQGAKGRTGMPATANAPKAGQTKAPAAAPQTPAADARQTLDVDAYARAAHDLYDAVLGPAAKMLGERRLVVVADGPLSFVPFEALVTAPPAAGAGSDYGALPFLVKTNEVAYAPSASVVGAVRRQRQQGTAGGQTAAKRGGPVLIVADPVFSASDVRVRATAAAAPTAGGETVARGLTLASAVADVSGAKRPAAGAPQIPRLAGTRTEANEIAQLARAASSAADVWLDLDASESNLKGRDVSRYGVIHFATHGLLDAERPQFTGLVLSLVGESESDGFLRVGEVFNFRLGSPLVMLSACETGLGRERRGEGVIGLPRAFMYAGASTVGVSLWAVSDRSTALLMSDFYRGLFAAAPARPADALRRAQLKMLADPRYGAPYYWAPFILIGDWT